MILAHNFERCFPENLFGRFAGPAFHCYKKPKTSLQQLLGRGFSSHNLPECDERTLVATGGSTALTFFCHSQYTVGVLGPCGSENLQLLHLQVVLSDKAQALMSRVVAAAACGRS